jgi:peptidoglycan/LPS O-acetylase OafA/YrhL
MNKSPRDMIHSLTGLRFFAALWVVLHNASSYAPMDPGFVRTINWGVFTPIIERGLLGVDIFFVLSGFVISYVYQRTFKKGLHWNNIWRFYALRLARIWPIHVSILFIIFAIMVFHIDPYVDLGKFDQLVYNFTLTTSWGFYSYSDWNGPAWSLSAEWFVYLLFPFISVLLIPRNTVRKLIIFLCTIPVIAFFLIASDFNLIEDDGIGALLRVSLGFMTGCALYNLYAFKLNYRWDIIQPCSWLLLLSSCFIKHNIAFLLVAPSIMAIVLSCAHCNNSRSLLSRPTFIYLGKLSFATYMVHQPIFVLQRHLLGDEYLHLISQYGDLIKWPLLMISLLIVIAAAAVLHHIIEQPCRRFIKRRINIKNI